MYLRINAIDPTYIGLQDILINLDTDCIESGTINLYKEGKEISSSIQEYVQFYDTIFTKVKDLGVYEIIDDDVIIRQEGYVPDWVDKKYNQERGFGDYLYFKINVNCKLMARSEELINLMLASLISSENNYDLESCISNIGRLTVLKRRFEEKGETKYSDCIDKSIETLMRDLEQWKTS
jgi:hypothetical protein